MRSLINKIGAFYQKRKDKLAAVMILMVLGGCSGYYFYYYQTIIGSNYITEPQIAFYNLGYKTLIIGMNRQLDARDNGITITDMDGNFVLGTSMNYKGFMNGKYIYRADFDFHALSNDTRFYNVYLMSRNKRFAQIQISANAFQESDAMKILSFFKSQRCGTNGEESQNCHLNDTFLIDNTILNLTGGWHTGGNYNKISFPTAYTLYILLDIYERITNNTNFKEQLENEILYGLNWLIRMQDPSDGGIFNKIESVKNESPNPSIESSRILKTEKYSHVSCLSSAVFAKASIVLSSNISEVNLLEKAEFSWNYSLLNPDNHPISEVYEYPKDDSFFSLAASELYRATNNTFYFDYFFQNIDLDSEPIDGLISGLHSAKLLSLYSFYRLNNTLDEQIREYLIKNFEKNNDLTAFSTVKRNQSYGFNFILLNHALDCVKLFEMTQNNTFLRRALDQFYFIVGNNPFRKSFIIGLGNNSDYQIKNPFTINSNESSGGMVHGPFINTNGDYEFYDLGIDSPIGQKYNEPTIENTAMALWMFTELMNSSRYNRYFQNW